MTSVKPAVAEPPVPVPVVASSFALGFIVLCLVVYVLYVSAAIMIPFVIAVFVWYLINALARGFGRLRLAGHGLPRFLCFFLAILCLVGGIWFTYKLIGVNAADVTRAAPVYQGRLAHFLPQLMSHIPEAYRPHSGDVLSYLDIGGFITVLVKTFSGIAGKTLVVLFYTGFLLYEQRFFARKIKGMISDPALESRVLSIIHNIDVSIQRYIWATTLISVATGVSTWLVLTSFNVDFAAFWGVMAFILNFIPYIGSIAAVVLPSIVALVQTGEQSMLVMVALALAFVQLLWGRIINPRMLGDTLNISPIFIIFSLAAWWMVWGVPGMFLSVPILAMIVITLGQFPRTRPIAILLSETGDINDGDIARADNGDTASARRKRAKKT